MLVQLSISNIILIETLDLSFGRGLSVMTGETGAGKSILLDSLALALGGRGDGSLVREGCDKGQVIAVFELSQDHVVRKVLKDNDIDDDGEGVLVIRRIQSKDGRSRVFINDQPGSVALLKSLATHLVEIHGQHDERALVNVQSHTLLLDAFGGLDEARRNVQKLFRAMSIMEKELKASQTRVEEVKREVDWLKASVEELEILSPRDGEEEELAEKRAHMMKIEKVVSDINEAQEILNGHHSPIPTLNQLLRRLERKNAKDPGLLDQTIAALNIAVEGLAQAQGSIETALRECEFNPRELEEAEERLFALRAASRKYNVPVLNLPELAASMISDLEEINASEEMFEELKDSLKEARLAFMLASRTLSGKRHHAAKALSEAVMAELPALKLERADFIVEISSDEESAGADGIDTIEFHVRTNPGTRSGPIMKVASGGELSRFLLALKVALAERGSAPTLVFDEIDTGAGGAVADAIGHRLARLSRSIQVLSVTHAPQVAARAKTHLLISKSQAHHDNKRVSTHVKEIDTEGRREEIARMLAGASITDAARAAAAQLLSNNS